MNPKDYEKTTMDHLRSEDLDLLTRAIKDLSHATSSSFKAIADLIFKDLSQVFGFDTVSLFSNDTQHQTLIRTYFWTNRQVFDIQANYEYPDTFSFGEVNSEISTIEALKKIPFISQMLMTETLQRIYIQPFHQTSRLQGMMVFEHHHMNEDWLSSELNLFRVLGSVCASFLEKSALENEIEELKADHLVIKQEKGDMLYQMSHELRTPLSGIHNAIYLLGTTNLSIEQKDYLDIGVASADVMSSVIDNVLDISKIEAGRMEMFYESFNLEEELINIYRVEKADTDEKGLKMHFEFDYRLNEEIKGDLRKLRQILLNLLSNAIKYTHHGSVTMRTTLKEIKQKVKLRFEIEDTGQGIPEKQVEIFNKLFQDSNQAISYGSGLGISLTAKLVELMGGHIHAESTLNQGTIFTLDLRFDKGRPYVYPLDTKTSALFITEQDSPYQALVQSIGIDVYDKKTITDRKCDYIFIEHEITQPSQLSELIDLYGTKKTKIISTNPSEQKRYDLISLYLEYPLSRMSLYQKLMNLNHQEQEIQASDPEYQSRLSGYALIVDDNRLNRIALENILLKEGLDSKSVESGPLAINAVQKEDFDLVLMDVQMPDMDGIETTRRIRNLGKKYESLPIIAVTANAFLSDYDFMKTSQMNDIVFKPIRMKNLNKVLRKYLKSTSTIHIPDELFVFDQKDFEQRFEGSFDIAEEVIVSFKSEYQKDLDKISKAIQDQDQKRIIEDAHYFKGSCAYLSGKKAVWLLSYMMNAAKRSHFDLMDLCNEMLQQEVEHLLEAIDHYQKQEK